MRLLIGPLSRATFQSDLPGRPGQKRLASLAAFTLGPGVTHLQRLVLNAAEVPHTRVEGERDAPGASRLGLEHLAGQHGAPIG